MITRKIHECFRAAMLLAVSFALVLVLAGCGDEQDKRASKGKKADPHAGHDHSEHDGHDHGKH